MVSHKTFSIPYMEYICSLKNCIGGVRVNVLASNAVDRGFEPRSSQAKDFNIGICCFSSKDASLRRKSKDWLARNQDDTSYLPRTVVSVS